MVRQTPLRVAQAMLLCIIVIFSLGVADPGTRFNDLGHKLMCSCGCNQVLLECNHVGCPASDGMRAELMAAISGGGNTGGAGTSDSLILQSFVQKYGPTILAAPTTTGFNRIAWIMPFAVLLLGMIGTSLLVRQWKLRTVATPAPAPQLAAQRNRIRAETDEYANDSDMNGGQRP